MHWGRIWILAFAGLISATANYREYQRDGQRLRVTKRDSYLLPRLVVLQKRAGRASTTNRAPSPNKQNSNPARKSRKGRPERPSTSTVGPRAGRVSNIQRQPASKLTKEDPGCNGRLNKRGVCFSSPAQPRQSRPQRPQRTGSVNSEGDNRARAHSYPNAQSSGESGAIQVAPSTRPQIESPSTGVPRRRSRASSTESDDSASSIGPQMGRPGRDGRPPDAAVRARVRGPAMISINNGRTFRNDGEVARGDILEHEISGTKRAHVEVKLTQGGGGRSKIEGVGNTVKAKVQKHTLGLARIKMTGTDGVQMSHVSKYTDKRPQRFLAWSNDPMKPAKIEVKSSGHVSSQITAGDSPLSSSSSDFQSSLSSSMSGGNAFGRADGSLPGMSPDSRGNSPARERGSMGERP